MKRIYAAAIATLSALSAMSGEITDVISSTTLAIPEVYEEQTVTLNSTAVYLVTLKDDGNGPQFKAGSSGIATKDTGGTLKRVEVSWGTKSNEDIEIYGQHSPYAASNTTLGGTLLGTIPFSAGTTVGLDIEGEWEYIGITTTTKKGKAAQFGSIAITWNTPEETPDEACDGVIISEVCGDDATTGGNEDWIELYNPTSAVLDISGVKIQKTDEDGLQEILCTIAEGTELGAGEYYVAEKGTHFTSGLSNNKNITITLISPLDKRLDMFDKVSEFTHNGSHPKGGSYCIEENTGNWTITAEATKGTVNAPGVVLDEGEAMWYEPVTKAETLADGMKVILVNREHGLVMSYDWDSTKDGGIYMYGYEGVENTDVDKVLVNTTKSRSATVVLCDGGDGTWALKFIDTNNYLNDSRFLACTKFKNMDFKKADDPAKGTRATITFNAGGDAEISYGDGGVIKTNFKEGGDSRFFNYDPTDKPEEHLAVTIYIPASSNAINAVGIEETSDTVYYNIQGIQVQNPRSGELIILKQGNKVTKHIVK